MEILNSFNINLDPVIKNLLDSHIILPGMNYNVTTVDIQQRLNLCDSRLELDPNMILRKSMTWKVLQEILHRLKLFLKPISQELDFLVYFYLHKSEIFYEHLLYQINKVLVCAPKTMDASIMGLSFDLQQSPTDHAAKLKEVVNISMHVYFIKYICREVYPLMKINFMSSLFYKFYI